MTVAEQNFQPQTRDTTNGPNLHTYVPRSDGAIMVGSIAYFPEGYVPAAAAVPTIPVVVQPSQPALVGQPPVNYPVAMPMPMLPQQPQPIYQQQPYMAQPQPYHGPGFQQPPFGTIGHTGGEIMAQQIQMAGHLEMDKPQEMKPADDDKFRFYWVRELDNTWSQRNRLTIDSGDIGDVRWYAKDGTFYAVRLPMS
ncbi:hypothetical protein LSUB1_G002718 [Lachnellula subtilissima]|uniref:Uncharacterized protein n=1 Tax=Lachnellula subtilissima TaxID=602034 RepID=A0A8H8RS79_9HELO|nr:hypothetical protein LSUB1_G002718 [Lachnellula subtilissima]